MEKADRPKPARSVRQPPSAGDAKAALGVSAILRGMVDNTDDFLTVVDLEGRFTFVNPAVLTFFGLTEKRCLGRSAFDFIHEDDRARTRRSFQDWVAAGSNDTITFENRQVGRGGTVRDMLWSIHALRTEDGQVEGFVSCARDMTQRKAAETELQKSEGRLRSVMSSMLDPVISIDVQGRILSTSESVRRVLGYEPDELVGQNVNVLIPEPHHSQHDEYLANYRRTRQTWIIGRTRDFEVLKKDGSRITCALSVSRTEPFDGVHEVFTGVFRDVSVHRRAEALLRESEARFHAIFDHAYQYLGLLTPDGKLLEANQTALDATGVTREEVLGQYFWKTRWWSYSKESQERLKAGIKAAAAGEFVRFETMHRGIGDAIIEVDFSLKPVKDEAGEVVLLIPEGRDISDIKRAQRAETAMLRAMATIGESAAVLAHEIKNPITAVNLALRAVADQLGEDHKAILEDLVLRMQRLEQLMRRTLSFAKPIDLRLATIDVEKLFEDAIAGLQLEIAKNGAQVTADIAPKGRQGALRIVGDQQLLGEVLSNLVLNALEAKGNATRIQLSARSDGEGLALLTVDDDGPGIPESLRSTLFKPFTTTKRKGNGLGLAICKKIVEEHGGTISIEEGRLSGARFAIRLPTQP